MVSIHMLTKVAAEKSVFVYLYLKFLFVSWFTFPNFLKLPSGLQSQTLCSSSRVSWTLERGLHFHLQKILVLSFYWISFDFLNGFLMI